MSDAGQSIADASPDANLDRLWREACAAPLPRLFPPLPRVPDWYGKPYEAPTPDRPDPYAEAVFAAMMLSPDRETCVALLRGEPVPKHRLTPEWLNLLSRWRKTSSTG